MGDHEHHGHHHTTEAPDNHDTLPQPGDGIDSGVSHPQHGGGHSGHHRGHHGGQFQNNLHWQNGVHKILKLMTAKYICAILV